VCTYDASGRRVEKNAGGVRTQYGYGAGGVVAEWVNGAQPMQGTWTVGYITFNGQMVAQYSAGTTFFAHKDHLGSLRVLTKLDKTVQDNMDYLPFGEQVAGSNSSTHKFTGHERDGESGLDYMGARYYTSVSGRFMSPDLPFIDQNPANPQSWNLYHYARNNPLAYTDPTGNASAEQYCTIASCQPMEDGSLTSIGASNSMQALFYSLFADVICEVCSGGVQDTAARSRQPQKSTLARQGTGAPPAPRPPPVPPEAEQRTKYGTVDEAGKAAINRINPQSQTANLEYGGWVIENSDGTFSSTAPKQGRVASVDLGQKPANARAAYHTHGGDDPNYVSEKLSPEDKGFAVHNNVLMYMGTPSNRIVRYDQQTRKYRTIQGLPEQPQ